MVFHALTYAKSLGRCWKPRPEAAVFNTSLGTWRMLMHWKTMFDRYYCLKTETVCYVSRYFLHYFVSPFHRCLANAICTSYARSRAGQYTSRNSSTSVAPVRSYWKLRSRALTAHELPVNTVLYCFLCNKKVWDNCKNSKEDATKELLSRNNNDTKRKSKQTAMNSGLVTNNETQNKQPTLPFNTRRSQCQIGPPSTTISSITV